MSESKTAAKIYNKKIQRKIIIQISFSFHIFDVGIYAFSFHLDIFVLF